MKKLIISIVIILPLIGIAAFATLPASNTHVYLHQNWFERTGYTDDNAEVELPFEVMLSDFSLSEDSTMQFQLLVQPVGNADPNAIEIYDLEPLQTERYGHYNLFVEEYSYNESLGKLQIFLTVEQLHYQLWLSKLGL